MMQIVEGEYYKTRDGRKVGPMQWRPDCVDFVDEANTEYAWWYKTGMRGCGRNPDPLDLISLWSEAPTSPVREVTKREIVDGTYGRVFCYSIGDDPKKVAVAFVKRGEEGHVDTPSFVLTEEELRAAAAVLLELAGALDA